MLVASDRVWLNFSKFAFRRHLCQPVQFFHSWSKVLNCERPSSLIHLTDSSRAIKVTMVRGELQLTNRRLIDIPGLFGETTIELCRHTKRKSDPIWQKFVTNGYFFAWWQFLVHQKWNSKAVSIGHREVPWSPAEVDHASRYRLRHPKRDSKSQSPRKVQKKLDCCVALFA